MVRIKHRYLLVNLQYPEAPLNSSKIPDVVVWNQPTIDLKPGQLKRTIHEAAHQLYGTYGRGAVSTVEVKYLSNATSTIILRVRHAHFRLLWSVLTMMNCVPSSRGDGGRNRCIFNVVRVCGTIRKAEEAAIRHARMLVLTAHAHVQSEDCKSDRLDLDQLFGNNGDVAMPDFVDVDADDDDNDDDDVEEDVDDVSED